MSVEINVLFQGTLPTKAALTRAMKELGFPLTISPPGGSLEQQSGYMPMRFRRGESGVEFDVFDVREDIDFLTKDLAGDIDPRFDRSANFRWGGDKNEMVCGVCAAAALAQLVNGVVLDDGEPLSVDEAIAWAKKHLHDATPRDKRGGTRPADIKRYLRALLKERSDLALIGRLLVVRPVRHLLRGAYFESHGRGQFRIWSHVNPLYAPSATTYGNYWHVAGCHTWEPHFEPLLVDALAEDVFTKVGRILTLNDFAAQSFDLTPFLGAQIVSWVLAGERDLAAAFVGQIENDESINVPAKELVKRTWGSVSGDIERICADRHTREAAAVKDLQLEHIWEPSPFPVELPAAERERRTAEPLFVPTPWISRPEWLLQHPPDHPGDVRFARERLFRDGRMLMVAVLSRAEAENRHRNAEPYVLAERLPDGFGLWLLWHGFDRDHPLYVNYRHDFRMALVGASLYAEARFRRSNRREGMLELNAVEIFESTSRASVWSWWADSHKSCEQVRDYRPGGRRFPWKELSDAEIAQLTCPWPEFGEYEPLVPLARNVLQSRGYGEIT
jgi:hypothetical protein